MLLRLAVVADGHEEDVARVFGHLLWVVAAVYLVYGGVGGVVVFQFDLGTILTLRSVSY